MLTHIQMSVMSIGQPIVVFEDADLDSVVEGVVNAIWFNQGQVCSAGSRLLAQESVYDRLIVKIKARMSELLEVFLFLFFLFSGTRSIPTQSLTTCFFFFLFNSYLSLSFSSSHSQARSASVSHWTSALTWDHWSMSASTTMSCIILIVPRRRVPLFTKQ